MHLTFGTLQFPAVNHHGLKFMVQIDICENILELHYLYGAKTVPEI